MAGYTWEDLRRMKVAELRQIAEGLEHEAVRGYTTLHKEQLLPALCEALGIEAHEHHEVVGVDKTVVKAEIRREKERRDAALASGDRAAYRASLRRIHRLKRTLRRAMT